MQKPHNMKLQEEKLINLEPKPIASSTKQVMQENEPKTWKNTKLKKRPLLLLLQLHVAR
jgi:hypothetical protein